ncbi:hypothetical protein [Paraflavitalea speifideaquila]|nr:hypothetical protein [Paraflavitalea speifideiaquila]
MTITIRRVAIPAALLITTAMALISCRQHKMNDMEMPAKTSTILPLT